MSRTGPVRVIRVRLHDEQPGLLLLDTPPAMASTMGAFPAARFVGHRRGAYALPAGLIDDLAIFAKHHDVLLVDDRHTAGDGPGRVVGPARPLPECSRCGQPARRDKPPTYCPSCGDTWRPIEHDGYRDERDVDRCDRCNTTQSVGFRYCGSCGYPIEHVERPRPTIVKREHLQEPLPIGAVADEVLRGYVE